MWCDTDTLCVLLSAKKWNSEDTTDFECSAKLWEGSKISIQSGPSNAHNHLHDDCDMCNIRSIIVSDGLVIMTSMIHQLELRCVFGMFEM